ncbi:MAG: CCA tRNA nucleotidyltransferase [Planctomycetota bacterium]
MPAESPQADGGTARDAALHIVRTLREAGHAAYFAGGCVRDQLLGLEPQDFDVATAARPEEVQRLFPRSNAVGAAFGVVLVYAGRGLRRVATEVATFRADGTYSDGRRPDAVTFTDARHDAQRRDFTINGLFLDPRPPEERDPQADPDGVIDFVDGRADLRAGVLRAIGRPEQRFAEDYLRMLRAVRFAARFGFALEPETAQAIRTHAARLADIARERIGDEARRMIAAPPCDRAARAAESLVHLGLDAPVFGCAIDAVASPATLAKLPPTAEFSSRLVAWLPTLTPRELRRALCLSNEHTHGVRDLRELLHAFPALPEQPIAQRKRRYTHARWSDALDIFRARAESVHLAESLAADRDALNEDGIGLEPAPLLTGDDLITAGHRPGPDFKTKLDAAYDAQLEGRVRTLEQALQMLSG